MFSGFGGLTFQSFLMGVLTILGGAIGARIWCELMIAIFKINENQQALRDTKAKTQSEQSGDVCWEVENSSSNCTKLAFILRASLEATVSSFLYRFIAYSWSKKG